ncbi:hypothetical protein AAH678_27060 [Sodalis endosymbiont of Spalangia cameroni]|uniref:hypothetical protein n=1 Tax=Sodalis praecaptivus TaxID=1239307 RepID=UPI0031F90380
MTMLIKSETYSSIYRTISDARINHIKTAKTKADATAMGLWDKIKDWFCGTRKAEALSHLYDLIHHDDTSEPQKVLQKIKAFHHLGTMAGKAYQDNFQAVITENPNGSWNIAFTIAEILQTTCSLGEIHNGEVTPANTTAGEQQTGNLAYGKPGHLNGLFFADLHAFLAQQNIAHPGTTLHNSAMVRLANLARFKVNAVNECATFTQIAHAIPPKTPDTAILVLQDTPSGHPIFTFADKHQLHHSAQMRQNAAKAAAYLHGLAEIKGYTTSHPEVDLADDLITAGNIKTVSSHLLNNLIERYRRAPPTTINLEETYKTPTEVSFLWMGFLRHAAGQLTYNLRLLVKQLLNQQQERCLHHKKLTLRSTRASLINDSRILRHAGLAALADKAATKRKGGTPCLLDQLPKSEAGLHATRLHDNIYGRVFDTHWIAQLVANPPAEVVAAMTTIARYYSSYLEHLLPDRQQTVLKKLHNQIVQDRRFWFKSFPAMEHLSHPAFAWPAYVEEVQKILRSEIKTGEHCIAIPYLTVKLFNATNDLPIAEHKSWQIMTNLSYRWYIKPRTGRTVEDRACAEANVLPTPAAGITLRYQPPAVSDAEKMTAERRPCNHYRIPASRLLPKYPAVKTALRHGLPYSGGVSGSTGIMLSVIKELIKKKENIDLRMGLLGTIMFMNYDGGHSIHEALWVANLKGIKVGNANDNKSHLNGFISDYEAFRALYQGTECGKALDNALAIAWEKTNGYLTANSVYYQTIVPPQKKKQGG